MNGVGRRDRGRDREAIEIVRLRRVAAVGRLMLGELNAPLEGIEREQYVAKPRRELKAELASPRSSLQNELRRFCLQFCRRQTREAERSLRRREGSP